MMMFEKYNIKEKIFLSILILLRFFTGFVLLIASWDKILNPEMFAQVVDNYKILPDFLINIFAITLPWTEAICGLFLIFGIWTKGASLLFNSFMVTFIMALGSVLYRNLDISCGCFTVSPEADKEIIISLQRDIFFLISGIFVFVLEYKKLKEQKDYR